jgi:hypothetical protein
MLLKRSVEFNPLDRMETLTEEKMQEYGIAAISEAKYAGEIDGVHFIKQTYTMTEGGWTYDTVSSVLTDDQRLTDVSGTMTGGWFTGEYGFNRRRLAALGKLGMEWTFVSVPTNLEKGWGDMEVNAKSQVRIGMAHAAMMGLNTEIFVGDGLSRGAIHNEAVMGVAQELGALYVFGHNTVACRINAVEEVEALAELLDHANPINLGRAALRGDLSESLNIVNVPHIVGTFKRAKKAIGEAVGGELRPLKRFFRAADEMLRNGASIDEVVTEMISKFHPDSIAIPWKIISRYPGSGDIKRLWRQALEAYDLTNGSYGELASKASSSQFRVHVGSRGDGLSLFEDIEETYADEETFNNTIIEVIDEDKSDDDKGAHLSSILEKQHQQWKGDWATIVEALVAIAPLIEAYSCRDERGNRGASVTQMFNSLRKEAASRNSFFKDKKHVVNPETQQEATAVNPPHAA